MSRTVDSELGMITLFDPMDLVHHEVDPADWYHYDFAFSNDLETGRFVALMTDKTGKLDVRLTTGPLAPDEQQAVGPRAEMRLRVIDHRLLLAGGDAWPSTRHGARSHAYDPRWIGFENGDYRVIISALDRQQGAHHDFVIQLERVDDILSITYAPGIPYLVVGQVAGVVGIDAGGKRYRESCGRVPKTAGWSPLTSSLLPLPGSVATVDLNAEFHARGRALLAANKNATMPIVVARKPEAGSIGLYIEPGTWGTDAPVINGEVPVTTRVLCAVIIRGVVPGIDGFELEIDPLPGATDRLSTAEVNQLSTRFENWLRLTSDPAWRYKSAQIKRTPDQRDMMLGIMDYLVLSAKHSESLLPVSNAVLATRLLEHMTID